MRLTLPNVLTWFRLAAIPVLLVLAALDHKTAFLWLLVLAWATDLVDGPIARMLDQESARGARLDSIADRGIMLAIPVCAMWLWPELLRREAPWIALLGIGLVVPRLHGWLKFRRLPAYHTLLAKGLAVYMGGATLLLLIGYWPWLFRIGCVVMLLEAAEEMAITHTLKAWKADVPSWWSLRRR
jgi:CDP-diacylglycerol--glycerol-3-phosphate 3-phosphatidyltransferase